MEHSIITKIKLMGSWNDETKRLDTYVSRNTVNALNTLGASLACFDACLVFLEKRVLSR